MGKSIKKKRAEIEEKALIPFIRLAKNNKEQAAKAAIVFDPKRTIRAYLDLYAVRSMDKFVSKIKSSNPHNQTMEVVRYAFNRYRTPAFLDSAWTDEPGMLYQNPIFGHSSVLIDYRLWYIALATGKSLYKEYTKGLLTKQETHFFSTCPYALSVCGALWYAINRAMDIPISLSRKIASTRLSERIADEFWKSVARWFSVHQTSIKEMNDLLDYIANRHIENVEWHLKDHTLDSLRKRMRSWHRELGRSYQMIKDYPKWDGIDVPDLEIVRGSKSERTVWKFHQIKTGARLAEEGNKQHHCVASYASRCFNGDCSIWSLTKWNSAGKGWHVLSIQVVGKCVSQVRGYANRLPKADEKNVMAEWATKSGFSLGNYY